MATPNAINVVTKSDSSNQIVVFWVMLQCPWLFRTLIVVSTLYWRKFGTYVVGFTVLILVR